MGNLSVVNISVSDIGKLADVVNSASSGDVITVKNGIYNGNSITIIAKGAKKNLIIMQAEY